MENGRVGPMFFIETLALTVEVFLRRDFGCRYFGGRPFIAVCVIGTIPVLLEGRGIDSMMWFLLAFLTVALGEWLKSIKNAWRGDGTYSMYSGRPRLLYLTKNPALTEDAVKKWMEPMVVVIAAGVLGQDFPVLGYYLGFAGVCLWITVHRADWLVRRQVMEINDAVVIQQQVAERFRGLQKT